MLQYSLERGEAYVSLCVKMDEDGDTKRSSRSEGEAEDKKKEEEEEEEEEDLTPRPRALHKTASIFLRNLAPTITKQEVEAVSLGCYLAVLQS